MPFSNEAWRIRAARANLTAYKYYVSAPFSFAWDARHIRYLDEKLMAVERGEIKRLMIWMPPRHYKSQSASAHFPAWYLGRHPDDRIIQASYSSDLVKKFSRQARGLVQDYGKELFNIGLSPASSAVDNWDIANHYGGISAVGVGGSMTGKGSKILIIDDPHKDREEANSKTMRDKVWGWYTSTARTRLEADGAIIVIQTRWHEEDLSGLLLKSMESGDDYAEQWEIVDLAAISEKEQDQLGRKIGEALWPQQFPVPVLMGIKAAIGSYEFGALYQQRPRALEGGAFKANWFKWYTKNEISFHDDSWWFHDERMTLYQGVDPAISEKTSADDFVIFTIGVTEKSKIILMDPFDAHLEFTEQPKMIITKYQEWLPVRIGLETNAYQKALKQQTVKDAVIPIKGLNHTGDKYTRIMTMTPFFENGQVYMRQALDMNPDGQI
jgi:predicted phage terminase large subunit-like protein